MPSVHDCAIYTCGIKREFLNQIELISETGMKGKACGIADDDQMIEVSA